MVDKTMMGDKCAELVRAAMIGALAVTLGNPTAVYAAEEETADPGQIGIEIAGEAAVRCVQLRKHSKAREKRYSFGYAVSFIFACYQILWTFPKSRYLCSRYLPLVCG